MGGIEENCVSREHAELRSISCGLMILKCTHRKALIIEKEDGREIVLEEGKEAVLSPGDIVKFNLHKYHYKVEDKLEKDENDTDSDEESEAIQLIRRGEQFNEKNGSSFRMEDIEGMVSNIRQEIKYMSDKMDEMKEENRE